MANASIAVLDRLVADQIAAGEVVERPGSVVKELVENSIDAGATKIQLDIESGGVRRIRVLDNGSGLPADQVELAFTRHATSKITSIDDLDGVASYGFRGEALPSIASVSKFTVRTRTADEVAGVELTLEGGRLISRREVGCPVGCEIEVRDLFFNTPARLKFLKRESTEASHCSEALVRLAAMRPEVAFLMKSGGRKIRELPRVEKTEERVAAMFGGETLARGQGSEAAVDVLAVLGPPERARAGAGSLYTYVNGRFIRDKTLLAAVTQSFGGTLERGRYPVGLISLDLPPGAIDVNVHPQKTEVRFADSQAVYRAVVRVVGEMVSRAVWSFAAPQPTHASEGVVTGKSGAPNCRDGLYAHPQSQKGQGFAAGDKPRPYSPFTTPSSPVQRQPQHSLSSKTADEPPASRPDSEIEQAPLPMVATDGTERSFSSLNYIGQARGLYLLLETDDDLVIVDQHAAHERVTYERLRSQLLDGRITSQRLLLPHNVDLGPVDAARIEERAEELGRLGLEVTRSGPDRVAVHGVPAELTDASPDRLLADMVLALEDGREGSRGGDEDHVLATMACHGSLRAGRRVGRDEALALIEQMDDIDFAGHCPHGRPVLTRIPWKEIGRRVGRE
jgi:DNA mismatch repair protein MutL